MNGKVGVYLRDKQVIVIPEGGGGGYSYDTEPVLIAEVVDSSITQAVNQALSISSEAPLLPPDKKPSISPVLKKLGIRSYKALYRNAAHCYLYEEKDDLIMLKFIPASDGRGFELTNEPPVIIKDRQEIGAVILNYLEHAPKMSSS